MRSEQIDVLKAVCAFLIVCIHAPFPGVVGEYFTALTRVAVPIFFMITVFFYVDVVGRGRRIAKIKKIFCLSVKANVIFLIWKVVYNLAKGRQVAVEGRIQTRSYDNNEGKKVYVTEVIANNVEFLGSGSSTNNDVQQNNPFNNAAPYEPTPFEQMPTESTSVSDDPFANFGEKIDISDNDLPF